ncbi:MAG TPA: copper chaperone PCu(A)C [Jatrophihabitans sp.]|nr:copper chaperone PCu(A)C [Jatrophihabitans sp.]
MKAGGKAQRATARRVGLAAAVAAGLLTSACAAGQVAQTADEKPTLDGANAKVGQYITLGGTALETPTDGISWAKDSNVPLRVVLVNSGQRDDQLTSITSPDFSGWNAYTSVAAASAAHLPPGTDAPAASSSAPAEPPTPVTVPAHGRVVFSTENYGAGGNRVLLLNGAKQDLHPGMPVSLTFTFATAGTVTLTVPVQLSKSPQTSIIPGPSATGQEEPLG